MESYKSTRTWITVIQTLLLCLHVATASGYRLGFDDNEIVKEEGAEAKPTDKIPPDVLEAYYYAQYGDLEPFFYDERRPGNATYTHSCDVISSVPTPLREPDIMKPYGLSYAYTKYTEAYNIPVVASAEVSNQALTRACYVLRFLLADRHDLRAMYYWSYGRVSIISKEKFLNDIPEYSFLGPEYSAQTRGLGAIPIAPTSSAGEENLLCLDEDSNDDEDIMLRHIAQGIVQLGLRSLDPTFDIRLEDLYEAAMASLWWQGSYATHSKEAYLGEGIQSYFNTNAYAEPANGHANSINSRIKLRTYDSRLYNMVHSIFPCANFYMKRCNSRANEYLQLLRMDCPNHSWMEQLVKRQQHLQHKRANRRSKTRSNRRRNKQRRRERWEDQQE